MRRWSRPTLDLREGLVVTALAYLVYALAGGVAFLPVTGYVDGVFEAMSGITTTGMSVLSVDGIGPSLIFFRSYSQWLGGAGIVVLSLVIILGPGRAAFRLYASEFGQESLLGSVLSTARVVAIVYLVLTSVAAVALTLAGMPPFQALVHAMASVSTGGFSGHAAGPAAFGATALACTIAVAFLASVSLPLYHLAGPGRGRRLARDPQVRALAVLAFVGMVLFAVAESRATGIGQGIYHALSALTTTGFSIAGPDDWTDGALTLALALMVLGGSTGSTAGGIKLLRLLVVLRLAGWSVLRYLLPPKAVVPLKVGDVAIDEDEVRLVVGVVGSYVVVVAGMSVALALGGSSTEAAVFNSVSAASTVGFFMEGPAADLAGWEKLLLAFGMWVGRLEFLPVLVLLHPRTWLERRT